MIFYKREKNSKVKKATTAALAAILGVTVAPYVSVETASAASETSSNSMLGLETSAAYDAVFKIPSSDILDVTNNGRQYQSSGLMNMFDGDRNTHWETGIKNTAEFQNYVTVTFKEAVELSSVAYYPRVTGDANKGFPTKFSVYASSTLDGDDFKPVHTGSATVSSGALNIQFDEPTTFKRLKFVFDEAHNYWASASELAFYKQDVLTETVDTLFTDGTMSQVNKSVTAEQVDALLVDAKDHPSSMDLTEKLQLAKAILGGEDISKQVMTIEQRGDGVAYARGELQTSSYGSNLLPTGIAALAGETIKVYVDAKEGDPLPQISFTQQTGSWSGWQKVYNLKQGENVFTVPNMHSDSWSQSVIAGGAIYILNPYTSDEQSEAPRIRISGGHEYPLFEDGDNVADFMQELTEYKAKLASNREKYVDIVELVNDHAIINSNMASAEAAFANGRQTPQGSLDFHEDRLGKFFTYGGLSEEERNGARANLRLMQPWAAAYASGDHTGFQQGSATTLFSGSIYGWAIGHELGHHFDHIVGKIPEVTNNMWANYNVVDLQGEVDRVESSYDTIFKTVASDDYANKEFTVNSLSVWWQLHLLDKDYWAKFQDAYRAGIAEDSELTKNERMVAVSSYALNMDVTEHFVRHKFINEESADKVKAVLQELKVPDAGEDVKPWYMWTKATKDRASKFTKAYKPEALVSVENGTVTVTASIDDEAKQALLGYEVLQDNKVIGFTRTGTFEVATDGKTHEYKVRAFDLRSTATTYSDAVSSDASHAAVLNQIKEAVKNVLTAKDVDIKKIEQVLVSQPVAPASSGSEMEKRVAEQLTAALKGKVNGKYSVYLTNYNAKYTSVDMLLQNTLMIMYQAADGESWYVLQNDEVTKRAE